MVLLSIFFTRIRSTEGSSADCSLFILSLHALALHLLDLKYFFKSFCMRLQVQHHTSVVVFPSRISTGPHFVTQPILLSENIPNIWHKSSTKHKEVRPDWNDKNDQTTAPSSLMEGLPMAQVMFKEIFDQVPKKDLDCWLFYSQTKTSQHYVYLLSSHR